MREYITIAPADTTRPRLMRSHHRIWRSSSVPLPPGPQRWNGWKNQENTTENRWPRLLNANASYAKADLWFVKGRKKLVRKPCAFAKKQERRTVNLSLLRWYAYLSPLRFWAILLPSNLLTSNQKKSDPERPGFFGQGSPAKTGGRSVLPFSSILNCLFHLIFPASRAGKAHLRAVPDADQSFRGA